MKCSSCGRDKFELTPKKSRLSGAQLFLCGECIENKREPRYIIILHGRVNGINSVAEYLNARRYTGAEILAQEFV